MGSERTIIFHRPACGTAEVLHIIMLCPPQERFKKQEEEAPPPVHGATRKQMLRDVASYPILPLPPLISCFHQFHLRCRSPAAAGEEREEGCAAAAACVPVPVSKGRQVAKFNFVDG